VGVLLAFALFVPVVGVLAAMLAGGRRGEQVAMLVMPVTFVASAAVAWRVIASGAPLEYHLGGWAPPLGIALRADGLSAIMMLMTAVVIVVVAVYARADFRTAPGAPEARAPFAFWLLLTGLWAAMNAVFLASDLFTLFVAMELLTFAAVPMVCLDGRDDQLKAALRYLLFALLGSVLYLLGAALLYGVYGTLDIALLAARMDGAPTALVACSLMTAGLAAKTALFPLHLWLPPAHAGAPAPASAVLSALVVKGSFFITLRLWFDVMPHDIGLAAAQMLATLGAGAIIVGSAVALRQARLKLLIAYSTIAQIGYLFLMFPLAYSAEHGGLTGGVALSGGAMQAVSHAFAKAGMFMAAGLMYAALGHDRIADLAGAGRALPMSVIAFGLGGISLVGLPPSGGFVAKWLLVSAAVESGQWWWVVVIAIGGLLASGYVFLVLMRALASPATPLVLQAVISRRREAAALALSLVAALLGVAALLPFDVVHIGRGMP
jgi:formate hydrogenlyase subunit 3/multisubunit Na+/H+ antiporter MnhD subunit